MDTDWLTTGTKSEGQRGRIKGKEKELERAVTADKGWDMDSREEEERKESEEILSHTSSGVPPGSILSPVLFKRTTVVVSARS